MKTTTLKPYTERQIALILVDQWLNGYSHPLHMDKEEMTYALKQEGYTVTEKRHEKIVDQLHKLLAPFEEAIRTQIELIK